MKALVVYDSVFGNTEKIAQVVAETLSGRMESTLRKIAEVQPEDWQGVNLLVLGSPTRAFKPTPGMSLLLQGLAVGALQGVKAVVFDTRIDTTTIKPKLLGKFLHKMGYAVQSMAPDAISKGAVILADPAWFYVTASEGPLLEGELERARTLAESWAQAAVG